MLATLNLQLLPVELPDDTLPTTASLLPDSGGEPVAGFADLLKLRVGESLGLEPTAGEPLPLGGSELPLSVEALAADVTSSMPPPAADLQAEPLPLTLPTAEMLPAAETPPATTLMPLEPEIDLEAVVLYPPTQGMTETLAAAPIVPVALPDRSDGAPVLTAIEDTSLRPNVDNRPLPLPLALQPQPQPGVMVSVRDAIAAGGDRAAGPLAGTNLGERPPVSAPPLTTATTREIERSLPTVELPQRPAIASTNRADAIAQEIAPLLRQRPIVAQPSKGLQAQLNLQQPPTLFAPPATSAVVSDLSYAAAAQQATDLIGTSVRDSIWGERVGERVLLMAGNNLKSAEIRLTPAEMGPLRVRVAVEDGVTHVTFHAQHSVTRDTLEQALPRLREMLAENGLTLGDAHVGDDGVAEGNRDSQTDAGRATALNDDGSDSHTEVAGSAATGTVATGRGLLDTFV